MATETDPALDELQLEAAERALEGFVRGELSQVAYEFTRAVRDSTELTAAIFQVSAIRRMWQQRVPAIFRRVLGITQSAAQRTARTLGVTRQVPPGWDNLPGASDERNRARLPEELREWAADVRARLEQIGDTLAREAVRELQAGQAAGETQAQLEARMIAAFNRNSHNMGEDRAQRIAATESVGAWNAGMLGVAAAVAEASPGREFTKRWITRHDDKVRASHRDADGQERPLRERFNVGGVPMRFPGDPTAPADTVINCRCVLQLDVADAADAVAADVATDQEGTRMNEDTAAETAVAFQSRMPAQLKRYWLSGPGAARIGWGTPGSFRRCVRELRDEFPEDTEGLCANLYHEATGRWPGQNRADGDTEGFTVGEENDYDNPRHIAWGSDGTSALAFEDVQTGDHRGFAPGALHWSGNGPWPLMYADRMGEGHDGAVLAGAIRGMRRNGGAIQAAGILYQFMPGGAEAAMLLSEGAPLGVSVDLDDVTFELVPLGSRGDETAEPYTGHLVAASCLPQPDGGFLLTGETETEWITAGSSLASEASKVSFLVGPDGAVPAAAFTAAAGDPVSVGEAAGLSSDSDYLMRITSARVRGATLVSIPAFADARIVLDDTQPREYALAAATNQYAHGDPGYDRVVAYVQTSNGPVAASDAAHAMQMSVVAVKRHLAAAAQKGYVVRIARGTYVRAETEPVADLFKAARDAAEARTASDGDVLTAAATGSVDLPVADRDHEWDGRAAERRVIAWADGDGDKVSRAFAYCTDGMDRTVQSTCKLGYADVIDGTLTIIPRGVFAAQAAMSGARGGVDIPADQRAAVENKLERLRVHVEESTGQNDRDRMEASAWSAIKDLPPMPADWFREPTPEELPTDMGGVHYASGRIFGWVARAGEPHAGFAKKITIESLGRIDTTHFLRQRFTLDDGSTVRAGALTMNTGHHRDGAECETSACAFDDTRTVAGIVTVGMNERGMWFSGAAHPTLSEWDRRVFMACEPSYHLRKGSNGAWQLRGVLTVPVPGHSTPMVASIASIVERNNLALTAAAQEVEIEEAVAAAVQSAAPAKAAPVADVTAGIDYDRLADAMVSAMARARKREEDEAAELAALLAEGQSLAASGFTGNDSYDGVATETDQEGA